MSTLSSPMVERASKRPRLPLGRNQYFETCETSISAAPGKVPPGCGIPSSTRRSEPHRQYLCHPITPPPSTPPSPGTQHAMTAKPPKDSMQSVISRVVPNVTVQDVQPLPSLRSQRLFDVQISDGSGLLLALPPPLMVKLLRSEQGSISSEAAVLNWLAGSGLDRPLLHNEAHNSKNKTQSPREKSPPTTGHLVYNSPTSRGRTLYPVLLAHSASSNEYGIEYNVLRSTPGVLIADIKPPLNPAERRIVNLRTGQFCRRLCKLVSPSGKFGPAFAVLPSLSSSTPSTATSQASRDANSRMNESKGVPSWSMAFHSMLEAVLRDGEDMAVMLGYSAVRRHFKQWEHVLDNVLTPRLVAVDAGNELNTMIVRNKDVARSNPGTRGQTPDDINGGSYDPTNDPNDPYDTDDTNGTDDNYEQDGQDTPENKASPEGRAHAVDVTGMKDWSNFVFGDPLFATVFSNEPTEDFLTGFYSSTSDESREDRRKSNSPEPTDSIVDDEETVPVRLLLYGCYHTITQIVKEFYRPQRDSSRRELAARKRLTHILAKLDELAVEAEARSRTASVPPASPLQSPRHRSSSAESQDPTEKA